MSNSKETSADKTLTVPQREALEAIRGGNVFPGRRYSNSIEALKRRGLVRFDDKRGGYVAVCPKVNVPRVEVQGRAVVERDGDRLLVMFPDGEIVSRPDARAAEIVIKRWFKARAVDDAINAGLIEWRDGIKPPCSHNTETSK